MSQFDLEWRHDRLARAVDLAVRALRNGHPTSAENSLIILETARDEDIRTGEVTCEPSV